MEADNAGIDFVHAGGILVCVIENETAIRTELCAAADDMAASNERTINFYRCATGAPYGCAAGARDQVDLNDAVGILIGQVEHPAAVRVELQVVRLNISVCYQGAIELDRRAPSAGDAVELK